MNTRTTNPVNQPATTPARPAAYTTPRQPRAVALALSCVVTLGLLLGIHMLAATDSESAPQMAQQAAAPRV